MTDLSRGACVGRRISIPFRACAELRVVGGAMQAKELVMIDPSPELPDDMPVVSLELPRKLRQALNAAGFRTVGRI